MSCRVYRDGKILRLDLEGVVTNDELAGMVRASHQFEFSEATVPHRIIDLTHCTELQLQEAAVQTLAKLRKAMKFPNRFKSAIVVTKPEHTAFVRMFASLNDHPQITIRIFPTLPEAQAWIAKT